MFVVAYAPCDTYANQCGSRCTTAPETFRTGTNLIVDERKQTGQQQSPKQQNQQQRLNDKNDVPRIPFLPKRPEWPHAVVVSEIEKDVAYAGQVSEGI